MVVICNLSLLFLIQNKHCCTGHALYHQYCHADLCTEERNKAWLLSQSKSFLALQTIVSDETILKDMVQLTKFSHTGILEVYHSVLNRWARKSTHFSYINFNQFQSRRNSEASKNEKWRWSLCLFSKNCENLVW